MRIHHLALRTRQLASLARFYRGVLGLRVVRTSRTAGRVRSIWMQAGPSILMLERAAPSEPRIPRGTLELIAFAVTSREHEKLRSLLTRKGIRLDGPPTPFTTYFRDPDGRRIAVSHFPAVSKAARSA